MSRALTAGPGLRSPRRPAGKARRLVLQALWMLCPSLAATSLLLLSLQLPWQPQPSQIRPAAPALVQPADPAAAQPVKTPELRRARQKPAWRLAAQE